MKILALQEEVALITDEWNIYMAGGLDTDDILRLCRRGTGQVHVFYSSEACQVFFSSLNGNADVEQSLSADKKTVTTDRASLSDM